MSEEYVFVVDVGSSSVKAGYSGEDSPSFVFPSTMSKAPRTVESLEETVFDHSQTMTSSSHPVSRGVVNSDWNLMEKLWDNIAETTNLTDVENTSVLVIESVLSTPTDNAGWAELLFETVKAPSICLSVSSPLTVYASGRTCGLAVECGAGLTSVVPVFEGFPLKHAQITAKLGGQDISAALKRLFNEKNVQIDLNSAKIVKEKLSYVRGYQNRDMPQTMNDTMTFCLPDGNDVTVETKILRDCNEVLFQPGKTAGIATNSDSTDLLSYMSESLCLCDDSVRKDLAQNIIISGGTSLLPGFGDRLQRELPGRLSASADPKIQSIASLVRVVPSSSYREPGYTLQRKHAAWIGGSLLGSFETYHTNLKITRQEWEENPDVVLSIKSI
eukprot:gene2140-2334_t